MQKTNIMPTMWLLVALIIVVLVHFIVPVARIIPFPWSLLGLIPLGLGVAINLMADKAFHQNNTTVKPFQESSALVADGVFRVTRNPMYLGFVLIVLGIALLLGSVTSLLVPLALGIFLDRAYIVVEEEMLSERFAQRWPAYKARTRRWL